jgi:hypothetical protein
MKNGKVVYEYENDRLNSKAIRVILISRSNSKHFNKKNMTHVKNLKSDYLLFRQKASAIKIERFFAHYLSNQSTSETKTFINQIKDIFTPIGEILEQLFEYKDKNLAIYYNGGDVISKDFKNEILKIANDNNWFDPLISDDIKKVEDWFKDIELLQYTDITENSLPALLKYIRSKGKKLNNDYYLKYVYPEPKKKLNESVDTYGQIIIMYPEEQEEKTEQHSMSKFKFLTEKQA